MLSSDGRYARRNDARAYRGTSLNGERAFIERLRAELPPPRPHEVWAGDDAAVLGDGLLATVDVLVEGVHFDLDWTPPVDVGWKSLAVNVSDLAAMGGTPEAALLSLVVPSTIEGLAQALLTGVSEAASAFDCPVVGGDTTTGSELVVSVTALGRAPVSGAVLRSGARPGDGIFVTGSLGGARRALVMLQSGDDPPSTLRECLDRPRPRVAEGTAAAAAGASSMIDLSDGLSTDLGHICDESGVGVRVDASRLPRHSGVSLDDAVIGGDDYELCFTVADSDRLAEAFLRRGLDAPTRIGEISEGPSRVLVMSDGSERPFEPTGWEHDIP